jgi:tetratricopeptide (TPR) repeat protein
MFLGRFGESWESIQQEAIEAKKSGSIKALDLCIKGCYFLYLLDYKKAISIFRDIIENQEIGSAGVRQNAITYLTRALIRSGQIDSETMRRMSLELAESRYPEARLRILCEYNLSQGKLDKALEYAEKTYNVSRRVSKRIAHSKASELKCRVLLKMGRPEEVITFAYTAIKFAQKYKYLYDLWRLRASKARALEMLGETGKAKEEYSASSYIINTIADTIPQPELKQTFLSDPTVSSVLRQSKQL